MSAIPKIEPKQVGCRPLLKWAGGKTQLLTKLLPKVPPGRWRYIEPFFGGGAFFFALAPKDAIVADSNPELINLYQAVADDVEDVIEALRRHTNTEEHYYKVRKIDWRSLSPAQSAARTLFLNRTCFNGLYRVNRAGEFNVPFGRYKNPRIVDDENLRAASLVLRRATILCADYKTVLREHARPGDFVFLDPPYLPISKYSDFKRYTKEQFSQADHVELAAEVEKLHGLGCYVILTNSNHALVHEQYAAHVVEVVQTKRHISCNGAKRTGEDVVVTIAPKARPKLRVVRASAPSQLAKYPSTRFMGSKTKLLEDIWSAAAEFKFDTVVDLFSGSGVVGYMFKTRGKAVISNDYMAMSATFARAMVENSSTVLPRSQAIGLLQAHRSNDRFVEKTFRDLYFTDEDNLVIDRIRTNLLELTDPYQQAIGRAALIRACMKKRPRGIFTYTGKRYDDGRRDLQISFQEHFLDAVEAINAAVFDNGRASRAQHGNALDVEPIEGGLVYIDPPYYSPFSDNEYVRRYHFVEGIARDWKGVEIQQHTTTKKFKSYPTPFSSRKGALDAFLHLFMRFRDNVLLVSYSSNSLPTLQEMVALMKKAGKAHVRVILVDHRYSFGNHGHKVGDNKNEVQEYLFVGY